MLFQCVTALLVILCFDDETIVIALYTIYLIFALSLNVQYINLFVICFNNDMVILFKCITTVLVILYKDCSVSV